MTPEERLTKIENAIHALVETQGRHDSQIAALAVESDKNIAGVRDLIVVSRALLESQKEVTGQIRESREAQERAHEKYDQAIAELWQLHKDTDSKLHALIAEVDRIIRKDKAQ